ncbi:MAG: glycosyltransferase family 4 protein [Chlorobium sp.]|jgi:glycosyltransferase involved in cell wall biosynthesis|nr:glycosyltransferase family 4 protein [Chlorobium sp.]
MKTRAIAYLCSEYPAISHTFIYREIESLRKAGVTVYPASIHKPSNLQVMTSDEREEAARTLMVLSLPIPAMVGAHLHCLLKNPGGYVRMIFAAVKLLTTGPKSPLKAGAYFAEAGILLEWMHRHGVTHIHEHFGNPTALVAMLMKHYGGVSFSISVHGPDIFYIVDTAMLAEKVREAAFVRCISHYCRSQIMRISKPESWKKLHIVRCGVDPDLYVPRAEPVNPVPNMLCVGRLVPAKGQHILLEACILLKKEGVRFQLTFVGDGPDRDSLEQFSALAGLNDMVTFTGALGQDKVRDYYDKADLFVLASFAEGVPVVLMEAMAKEIPVISTRITGIPELIEHDCDGLLATPGDAVDLARQIRKLLDDSGLRRELGVAGRKKVVGLYNQHGNNSAMVDLFHLEGISS